MIRLSESEYRELCDNMPESVRDNVIAEHGMIEHAESIKADYDIEVYTEPIEQTNERNTRAASILQRMRQHKQSGMMRPYYGKHYIQHKFTRSLIRALFHR